MKGRAEEICPGVDPLEIRLYREKGNRRLAIARYRFTDPLAIAQIIQVLNSKSDRKILEGYIEGLEEISRISLTPQG